MAIRLTGWLEKTFATELFLGNATLEDNYGRKQGRTTTGREHICDALYHDNGSCLDITNTIDATQNSYLQIIQSSPLTLSDGQHHIETQVSRELSTKPNTPSLASQSSLNTIIAVRKYTIRYTAYGPPRDHLRLILHTVDRTGVRLVDVQDVGQNRPKPLRLAEEVASQLRELRHTRASGDRNTIGATVGTPLAVGEMAPAMTGHDTLEADTQPHTQFAFGSQINHPIRPQQPEDEPLFVGKKRMEPILAGTTQRQELRPNTAREQQEQQAKLLSLLHKQAPLGISKLAHTPAKKPATVTSKKEQDTVEPPATPALLTQLPAPNKRHPKSKHTELEAMAPVLPKAAKETIRVEKLDHRAIAMEAVEEKSPDNEHTAREREKDELQTLASQCSWMKNFEFSRDALRVDPTQLLLLTKEESWHKPPPGYSFPALNVPRKILNNLYMLADENAAIDAGPDSEDEMDEDPCPESAVQTQDPSTQELVVPTQEDQPLSSQISWSASPSPEPPKLSRQPGHGLPPDSSLEIPDAGANDVQTEDVNGDLLPQQPIVILSSNEKEPSLPPSSPPNAQEVDSDEDMEMEVYEPQALGEDSTEGAMEDQMRLSSSESPRLRSVVQVRETPYAKGKPCHPPAATVSHQTQIQESTHASKHTSSASIVPGTYNDATSSGSTKNLAQPNVTAIPLEETVLSGGLEDQEERRTTTSNYVGSTEAELHVKREDDRATKLTMQEQEAVPEQQLAEQCTIDLVIERPREAEQDSVVVQLPSSTPASPAMAVVVKKNSPSAPELFKNITMSKSPSLRSGSAKRKLANSPSKKSGRQSKRRELKIVSFGDGPVPMADSVSALQQYHEEQKRTFLAERKSSTSVTVRASSNTKPSPEQDVAAMDIDLPSMPAEQTQVPPMSPRHLSLYEEPSPREPVPIAAPLPDEQSLITLIDDSARPQQVETAATFDVNDIPKVFDIFNIAYPEYTGDAKHFQGQCKQMLALEEEDKMVPKWQWDDYIIRNRIDYKEYVLECVEQGDNPQPYYRFYKDTISNTLYNKGIVKSVAKLAQAIGELGNALPASKPTVQKVSHPPPAYHPTRAEKHSRASLPSAFPQSNNPSRNPLKSIKHDRPRHSLPTEPTSAHRTSAEPIQPSKPYTPNSESRSTSEPKFLSRLHLDGAASSQVPESSGDEFRDAVFASMRLKSWTGSKIIDTTLPWPRNLHIRPSIADLPRRKIDVLGWKDDL